MKHHRIWTNPPDGPGTWRELHKITRNEYGDILLTLDGGEVWQFTPHTKNFPTPAINEVDHVGFYRNKAGQTINLATLLLTPPKTGTGGNVRIIPPAPAEADATKKARQKAGKENGKAGGRKPHPNIKEAILSVHENVKGQKANEPYKRPSIFLACENVINEMKLPFKVDNLRKQYRVWKVNRRRGKN